MPYRPGDIVLADILDPDGKPCAGPHRALVLRIDAERAYLVGITSSFDDPPPGRWIRMKHSPGGHRITGLDRPCVLKCDWVVRFKVSAIIRKMGELEDDEFDRATDWIVSLVEEKKLRLIEQG